MFQPGVGERKEFLFLYFWTWQICAGNGIKKKEKVPEVKGGEEILLRAGSKAVFSGRFPANGVGSGGIRWR